ncbi:MAG: metallophosphoesterase family protein [Lentisphaeria bacterium]|nr:metallophosphoesterase family protein [Lentisphaeria bacterium]
MKYAVFGDIHANLEALTAVLERAAELDVDKYVCMGDIVGYNANPRECLRIVQELGVEMTVKGNHDEQASADSELIGFNPQAAQAIEWTRDHLDDEDKLWLSTLPYKTRIGTKVTLVHATLDMPHMWGYIFDKFSAEVSLEYQFTSLCFFGHTHVPLAFEKFGGLVDGGRYSEVQMTANHKYLINVGSVGQPRDGDPRASFATYCPEEQTIQLHRVDYDVETAQDKIRRAGLPERLAERLGIGR